ncbi:hypothetical protein SDC9_81789 [bioreactor metagenome]|uniref:Uncharacterized protein n=1 Tax=bioreactor metagenome TaxID=1076179 RepID=A0A644Z3S2_9ZZZZ
MLGPVYEEERVFSLGSKPPFGDYHRFDIVYQDGWYLGVYLDGFRQGNILPRPVVMGEQGLLILTDDARHRYHNA